jgi:hypothetical protein
MNAYNPFAWLNPYNYISLNGDGVMRSVTVALPCDAVRSLLPYGLELAEQSVTEAGTHPVIFSFNDMVRAHMTFPPGPPSLSYHEHMTGVPYCNIIPGMATFGTLGPFYYMPFLHVDSFLATLGGVTCWGFAKQMASFRVTEHDYAVTSNRGESVTNLEFHPVAGQEEFRAVDEFETFAPIRKMLDQPMVSMLPAAVGPLFVASNFDKQWSTATLRPIRTEMQITEAYVPGLPTGSFRAGGIHESVLGSYDLRAPWRLSLVYPPALVGLI